MDQALDTQESLDNQDPLDHLDPLDQLWIALIATMRTQGITMKPKGRRESVETEDLQEHQAQPLILTFTGSRTS